MRKARGQPTIRVILADDHTVVRAGIRRILETATDIKVIAEAENGEQAIEIIGTHTPDVAVLDIRMPKASGIDVTRWISSVYAGKSAVDPEIARKVLGRVTKAETAAQPEELTAREREVLALVAKGHTNKAIGSALQISARTVQGHLSKIFDKLQAESRTEAVMRAVSLGWLPGTLGSGSDR
jgi:DNA-binding NarL/FixJ family response regulator